MESNAMQLPEYKDFFWREEIALGDLPDRFANDIRENLGDEDAQVITRFDAIKAWLEWNGILGYNRTITDLFAAVVSGEKLP